jgi:hypothetical protein
MENKEKSHMVFSHETFHTQKQSFIHIQAIGVRGSLVTRKKKRPMKASIYVTTIP